MSDKIIRASEIGDYIYCKRKWFLRHRRGLRSVNREEMAAGTVHHERHAYWLNRSRLAGRMAVAMLLLGLIFLGLWYLG